MQPARMATAVRRCALPGGVWNSDAQAAVWAPEAAVRLRLGNVEVMMEAWVCLRAEECEGLPVDLRLACWQVRLEYQAAAGLSKARYNLV